MGGDYGLRMSLPASLQSLSDFDDIDLTLVGDQSEIASQLKALGSPLEERIQIVHADEVVAMDDKPSHALKHKRQSSMRLAIDLLATGEVDAVVSAGNTGALMAMGTLVVKTVEGIQRPAICTNLPTLAGHTRLLDLGANVDASAEQLHQFAVMGSALCSIEHDQASPRVALLNIGEEAIKGNELVKQAGALLQSDASLNYVGSVEADNLLTGHVDVIVCDGFVGNVALKTMEGTAQHIAERMRSEFQRDWLTRLQAFLSQSVLGRLCKQLDPEKYNGASLLGLNGVIVKSHGSSSVKGFSQAICQARLEVQQNILGVIRQQMALRANHS